MKSETTSQRSGVRSGVNAYVDLIALAHAASTAGAFYGRALRVLGEAFASPLAACYIRLPAQEIKEEFHSGPTDPKFWRAAVQKQLTLTLAEGRASAQLLSAKGADLRIALLAAPVFDARGEQIGAVALVTRVDSQDTRRRLAYLESLVALLSYLASVVATPLRRSNGEPLNTGLAKVSHYESVEQLAISLTTSLRNKLGCEQVALGLVQRRRARVIALSGFDEVKPRSPGVGRICAAMEECIDIAAPLACQRDGVVSSIPAISAPRLHKQWHEDARGATVATLPLCAGKQMVAVVALRRRAEESFTLEELQKLQASIEPFASAFLLLQRAQRGLWTHVRDQLCDALLAGGVRKRLALGLGVAASLWFLFGTIPYRVAADCIVAPADGRIVSAPISGVVLSAPLTAGQSVRAGAVLAQLDTRALRLEQKSLQAELAVAQQERLRGAAAESPADAKLAEARATHILAQLANLDFRIESALIRAPIDGVIIRGDLREQIGATVQQGATLFEIAPAERWRFEVRAPEAGASDLTVGQLGHFAPQARPESVIEFRVLRVHPAATPLDGANRVLVEAEASAPLEWLRPGMQGVARIEVGDRPVWWVALHRLLDALRLGFWI